MLEKFLTSIIQESIKDGHKNTTNILKVGIQGHAIFVNENIIYCGKKVDLEFLSGMLIIIDIFYPGLIVKSNTNEVDQMWISISRIKSYEIIQNISRKAKRA